MPVSAVERDFSFQRFLNAKDRSSNFRAPCPDQSCEPKHFTLRDVESELVDSTFQRAQASHLKTAAIALHRPTVARSAFEEVFQIAPDHHSHHALVRDPRCPDLARILTITKHDGSAVRDLFNFVHAVRDVNDADVVCLEILYQLEQATCFPLASNSTSARP